MADAGGTITCLLVKARNGSVVARDELFRMTQEQLRRIALNHLASYEDRVDRAADSLINDAVVRMLDGDKLHAEDREQFFGLMWTAMRDVLVESFRRNDAIKRGGKWKRVLMVELVSEDRATGVSPEALDAAMSALRTHDVDAGNAVVHIDVYGGTIGGASELSGRTYAQTRRDHDYGRAWLKRRLRQSGG